MIDPELATFIATPPPNDIDDVAATRRLLAALTEEEVAQRDSPPPGLGWHDEVIEVDHDTTRVPIRIYWNMESTGPSGALLFFHGGAFVFGNLESEHLRCVRFAERAGCVVVSVDYRLAPEHPYPAAIDDGGIVLEWLRRNAESLMVDTERIGVGGTSAGGALAAGLVLRTRDRQGPWLRAQLLIYPAIDNQASTPSVDQFYRAQPWDGERTRKMWKAYLGDRGGDVSPYASVARATNLSSLPPTYVMTAEEDPLRDEAIVYAQRLLAARNAVELHLYAGTYHGFDAVAQGSTLSELALEEQVTFLKRELGEAT